MSATDRGATEPGQTAPSTASPGAETPSTQTPSPETPGITTRDPQTSSTQTPDMETPGGTQTPGTQTPSTQTPSMETSVPQTPGPQAPRSAQRPIGFWLTLVGRLVDEHFSATLDEHGVTRRQWQLLNVLSAGPASATELDAAIEPFLDREAGETSADHLAELVESGWVTVDGIGYELTERGRTACARLAEVVSDVRTIIGGGISEDEYKSTLSVLERMAHNLGWTDSQ